MKHIEQNNIEVRQLMDMIFKKSAKYTSSKAFMHLKENFQNLYKHYKEYPYPYMYSHLFCCRNTEHIFMDILTTLHKTINNFQITEKNFQYFCEEDEKFTSNRRAAMFSSLDFLLCTYSSPNFKIYFPKLIQAYIPIEHTKKVNWTKHHTRAQEDEYELLIRDNLPEFLKHSKIEYLKKANYLHVINFMKKKYNLSISTQIAKVVLQYLKDDLENEQDDE